MKIAFHVNEGSSAYWLSLLVVFEGGDGDIGSMYIKQVFCYSRTILNIIVISDFTII